MYTLQVRFLGAVITVVLTTELVGAQCNCSDQYTGVGAGSLLNHPLRKQRANWLVIVVLLVGLTNVSLGRQNAILALQRATNLVNVVLGCIWLIIHCVNELRYKLGHELIGWLDTLVEV